MYHESSEKSFETRRKSIQQSDHLAGEMSGREGLRWPPR